jgi:hypothetical protein
MAFQEVGTLSLKEQQEGFVLDAILLGKEERETSMGHSMLYTFATGNGEMVNVWGFSVLDRKLKFVPSGAKVRITMLKKTLNKTGSEMYDCKVEVDLKQEGALPF